MVSQADSLFSELYAIEEGFFAITVTLKRGNLTTASVPAIVQITDNQIIDPETGFRIIITTRDYVIAKADYVLGGSAVTPQRNDYIVETINSVERSFEVKPYSIPASSKTLPEYEDEHGDGVRWLIRTKEVEN